MTDDRNNGSNTDRDGRGRFAPGNPGRRPGARHRTTQAVESLLDGEAEKLTRKAVALALKGDVTALRICLDRIAPARRDPVTMFELPALNGAQDHPAAIAAVIAAVASGDLSTSEAEGLCRILGEHRKSIETADLETRIAVLEGKR